MSRGVTLLRCVYELAGSHLCAYDLFLSSSRSTRSMSGLDRQVLAPPAADVMYTLPKHMRPGGENLVSVYELLSTHRKCRQPSAYRTASIYRDGLAAAAFFSRRSSPTGEARCYRRLLKSQLLFHSPAYSSCNCCSI